MKITDHVPPAALYEQLAEECTELAHEALKMSRVLRGENPTPCTIDEAALGIQEELTDVLLCAAVIDLQPDMDIWNTKMERWTRRITNAGKNKQI